MLATLLYIPVGFLVAVYGTIIGAGGGFILVPLLMFLFPSDAPSMITAASLAVIFVNSTSGTIAYARMKRISYKTGILFALATIPGAVLGSYLTGFIPKRMFGAAFGGLLLVVAAFLSITRGSSRRTKDATRQRGSTAPRHRSPLVDTVVDSEGTSYPLSYNIWLGMGLSLLIGVISSLAGIGGGLIHVPVLTYLFGFPVHIATATSHFVLVFTSLAGVVMHLIDGTWPVHPLRDLCLAVGVIGGAQLGAVIARKVSSRWIVLGLAIALGLVGVRLIIGAL
ncbi:MAG: sulfite exporter TauE/SafE family protein [Acidobacteria bacterium]|nr:sulfite exporter TauE/SafE family protein [Acidobacteriota bacterium]